MKDRKPEVSGDDARPRAAWSKPRLEAMLPADRTRGGIFPYRAIENGWYSVS